MGASVRLRVIGKGALIRETKELDSAKVVQLTPETIVWGLEQAQSQTGIERTRVETLDGAHGGWVSAKTLERVAGGGEDEAREEGEAASRSGGGGGGEEEGGGFWSRWKSKVDGQDSGGGAAAAAPAGLTPEEKRAAKEAAKQAARVEAYERKCAARAAAKKKLEAAPATKAARGVRESMAADHKKRGNAMFGAKQYGDACREYGKAAALLTADGSDYGPVLCNRSACHALLGRRAEAVAHDRGAPRQPLPRLR